MLHPLTKGHKPGRWAALRSLLLGSAVLAGAVTWPRGAHAARDLDCAQVRPGRAQEICGALARAMEWTWLGHAIVAPGWRITFGGLRRVYCGERISAADVAALETLTRAPDWRLQSAAENLLRLIRAAGGTGDEPETSIFNPRHPDYLLKGGCTGGAQTVPR